ncbi:hypothetical protein F0U60_50290 [Archangium minus]|uniref:Uncharacterized protein n=1 Tax=Archangium minus TaxID=83450 RepID=A0ABY9X7Q2_9BACT|nr:hypothetical protein F0U60_50290 [Archangium minus]
MAHVKDEGLAPRANGSSRPSLPRTPPRVWPPVSPGDMGRVVRRLKVTAERPRPPEPEVPLLEGAA